MKRAFTLLELIIVMVVMGILASIGTQIFANVFRNYVQTRNIHNLEAQTQNASEIIAKLLSYRVVNSLAVCKECAGKNGAATSKIYSIDDENVAKEKDESDIGMVWLNQDYDSIRKEIDDERANTGFMYYKNNKIVSPGTEFKNETLLIPIGLNILDPNIDAKDVTDNLREFYSNLSNFKITNASYSDKSGGEAEVKGVKENFYKFQLADKIYRISRGTPNKKFKTLNTGYADLFLYVCDKDNVSKCNEKLLMENATSLRFRSAGNGGVIIKLCVIDPTLTYENKSNEEVPYEVCKTKVVR